MKIIEDITRMTRSHGFEPNKWGYLATSMEFNELAAFVKRFHADEKDFIWPTSSMTFMGVVVFNFSE